MDKLLLLLVLGPMLGAPICYAFGKKYKNLRDLLVNVITLGELGLMLFMSVSFWQSGQVRYLLLPRVCGLGLSFTMDGFRSVYGVIAAFMWAMTALFSPDYFKHYHNRSRYYMFFLLTLGATTGVFLSADLYTTFIFFEIMSFTSYVWVAQDEKEDSLRAAQTYLAVAVIGGMVMLMGLFLLYQVLGTLNMSELMSAASTCENRRMLYIAGGCTLVGFGAKAGAFPLHIWLPKAHPVAPAPASALLSGILTKSGIFGILVITTNLFLQDVAWGKLLLLLGVITMAWGALLALFSVNLKRTLACSSMSQIGFILIGIATSCLIEEGRAEAVQGTILHMLNHSLIKLVLFMAAGVVYMNIHQLDLNKIRGFGRKKYALNLLFLSGALSIGGIPFVGSGYISKTLLHEGLVAYGDKTVEWIFLISGGCTVAYMTKLYICLFWEKNKDQKLQKKYDDMKHYMNPLSYLALICAGIILPVMGAFPALTMEKIGEKAQSFMKVTESETINFFSLECLEGAAISIGIGLAVYGLFVRLLLMKDQEYVNRIPFWMDLENYLYRPVIAGLLPWIYGLICRILDSLVDTLVVILRKTIYRDRKLPGELLEGNRVTVALGHFLNGCNRLANQTWRRKNPKQVDYVHRMAMVSENVSDTLDLVSRSLSYGLLLFGLGLFVTVGYLLFYANM